MSEPAGQSMPSGSAQRFAGMSLSELLAEWEDRLLQSERPELAQEIQSRGYRMDSLSPPASSTYDILDDEAGISSTLPSRPQDLLTPRQASIGSVICCVLCIALLLAPGFHLGSFILAALLLALGVAVQRRSRLAARAAVFILGLNALAFSVLLLLVGSQSQPEPWFAAGAGAVTLVILIRVGASLALRPGAFPEA